MCLNYLEKMTEVIQDGWRQLKEYGDNDKKNEILSAP